ncbi:MAG: hypothetical protein KF716_29415 [Anaerolineae bacterium]|nr:hypothetical protein [Anaerolineae bacterium]
MKKLFFCVSILILSVMSVAPTKVTHGVAAYVYAFAERMPGDSINISAIDPITLETAVIFHSVPDANLTTIAVILSPDGEKVALWSRRFENANTVLKVIDIRSGKVLAKTEFVEGNQGESVMTFPDRMRWSPNSAFIAFNASQAINTPSDVHILSLATDIDTNVTHSDQVHDFQFSWPPNSAQLLVVSGTCSEQCDLALDLYSVPSFEKLASVPMKFLPYAFPEEALCSPVWSPDAVKVAFTVECHYAGIFPFREIYVFDISRQQFQQVTSFSHLPLNDHDSTFYVAKYSFVWMNTATLAVGASIDKVIPATEVGDQVAETVLFHLGNPQAFPLLDYRVEQWARNPATEQVAFRLLTRDDFDPLGEVFIGSFVGETLAIERALPDGGDFQWSPDGAILAYRDKQQSAYSITFVDMQTGIVHPFTIITSHNAFALGWTHTNQ